MDNPAIIVILAVVVVIITLVVRYFNKEAKFEDLMEMIYTYVDSMKDLYKSGVSIVDDVLSQTMAFAEKIGLKIEEDEVREYINKYLSSLDEEDDGNTLQEKSDDPNTRATPDNTENTEDVTPQ